MIVRRYTYDNDGTEKSVLEFTIPVLYDNAGLEYSNLQNNSKLMYRALLDGNANIKHTDKVVVDNFEYNIKSLNLVQYQGTMYLYKLEAEP